MSTRVESLVGSLRENGLAGAEIAFVLGSGLGAFSKRLERPRPVSAADLDGLPLGCVPGHTGRIVAGEIAGVRVLVQEGRVHLYEGWSEQEVTRAVRAFAAIGVRALVLTNAAGGIRPDFRPGNLMRISDHINLQGRTPLARAERGFDAAWDAQLGLALEGAARAAGVALENGVYAGLAGPAYETPAEIRWLRSMGADAVGMSTVAEAITARACGMRVVGVSCITNLAAGLAPVPLSHVEVLEAGQRSAHELCALLERAVRPLIETLNRG